jgi:hypothetical protein
MLSRGRKAGIASATTALASDRRNHDRTPTLCYGLAACGILSTWPGLILFGSLS